MSTATYPSVGSELYLVRVRVRVRRVAQGKGKGQGQGQGQGQGRGRGRGQGQGQGQGKRSGQRDVRCGSRGGVLARGVTSELIGGKVDVRLV